MVYETMVRTLAQSVTHIHEDFTPGSLNVGMAEKAENIGNTLETNGKLLVHSVLHHSLGLTSMSARRQKEDTPQWKWRRGTRTCTFWLSNRLLLIYAPFP